MKMKTKLFIALGAVIVLAGVLFATYGLKQEEQKVPPPVKPEEAGAQLFERGEKLYKEKYYASFVALYEKMLKELPDNADLKKKLAFAYFGMERYEDAKPLLEEVAKTPIANAEVFYELGFIEQMDGDKESAKQYLKKALEIDPEHQDAKKALQGIR